MPGFRTQSPDGEPVRTAGQRGSKYFLQDTLSRSFKQSFDRATGLIGLAYLFTSKVRRKNVWSILISLSKSWECEVGRLNNKPSHFLQGSSSLAHIFRSTWPKWKCLGNSQSEQTNICLPVQSSAPPCIQSNLALDRVSKHLF